LGPGLLSGETHKSDIADGRDLHHEFENDGKDVLFVGVRDPNTILVFWIQEKAMC